MWDKITHKLILLGATCAGVLALGGVAAGNAFALQFTAPQGTGYTSTSGAAVLAIPALNQSVICESDTNEGNTGNGVAGTVTVTFEECENELLGPCQSAGQAGGTIKTNLLNTDLVWINSSEFGILFSQSNNPAEPTERLPLAEFECAGVVFTVIGNVRGKVTNPGLGVLTNDFTVELNPTAEPLGQNLYTDVLGERFLSTEETTDVVTLNGGAEGEFKSN